MKVASIVFLVISILIIGAGILTSYLAYDSAIENGIDIFNEYYSETGDYIITEEIPSSIKKIIIDIDHTSTVNLLSSTESSYIEMVNYTPYSYMISNSSDSVISITDTISAYNTIISVKNNGLRHLLKSSSYSERDRIINVYLSDDDIEHFDINISNGSFNANSISSQTNYSVIIENGNVCFDRVYTDSKLYVSIKNGDADFIGCVIPEYNIELDEGDLNCEISPVGDELFDLHTSNGNIYLFGTSSGQNIISEGFSDRKINAKINSGDIIISEYSGDPLEVENSDITIETSEEQDTEQEAETVAPSDFDMMNSSSDETNEETSYQE